MENLYFILFIIIILVIGFIITLVKSLVNLNQSCPADNLPHDWLYSRLVPNKDLAVYCCSKCGKLEVKKITSSEKVLLLGEQRKILKRVEGLDDEKEVYHK